MKLKIPQANELKEGLLGLNGVQKVVDGKVILEPFRFSGKVRWNLGKNLSIFSAVIERYDKVKNDILLQVSKGTGIIKQEEVERMAEYVKLISEILDEEEEIEGILKIKESDLNLEENAIPVAVIKALIPIIE